MIFLLDIIFVSDQEMLPIFPLHGLIPFLQLLLVILVLGMASLKCKYVDVRVQEVDVLVELVTMFCLLDDECVIYIPET